MRREYARYSFDPSIYMLAKLGGHPLHRILSSTTHYLCDQL